MLIFKAAKSWMGGWVDFYKFILMSLTSGDLALIKSDVLVM